MSTRDYLDCSISKISRFVLNEFKVDTVLYFLYKTTIAISMSTVIIKNTMLKAISAELVLLTFVWCCC